MTTRQLRCAVYCRKSSEEGLEQAFNSLDAQREAGLDYIRSQRHQGWTAVAERFEDGGYSGGTTDRPALQRLLEQIRASRVDVVVVYKVDRLSRSLADFARLMQEFEQHGVSFVSVTQQFSTTTSMGRLTLNMLLSFAQFEREVAGERIRDKIAATKRKGVWVCGQPPLGYRLPPAGKDGRALDERVLQVVPTEAELIRTIFRGYLRMGSLVHLAGELNAAGRTTRRWTSSRGIAHGGKPLTTAQLYRVLTNPVYTGQLTHTRRTAGTDAHAGSATEVFAGRHAPIIDRTLWNQVQERMTVAERQSSKGWSGTHLLKGKLRTHEGFMMSPSSVQRPAGKCQPAGTTRRLVRYYVSQKAIKHGYAACPIKSLSAELIDGLVRSLVAEHLGGQDGVELDTFPADERDCRLRHVIDRVVIGPEELAIELLGGRVDQPRPVKQREASDACMPLVLCPRVESTTAGVRLTLALRIKRISRSRFLVSPEGELLGPQFGRGHGLGPCPQVVRAIGLAYLWREALLKRGWTIRRVAEEAGASESTVHQQLALTQLAPEAIKVALIPGRAVSVSQLRRLAAYIPWKHQSV